jgi:nitrous oxide reductase accessory protein NosL
MRKEWLVIGVIVVTAIITTAMSGKPQCSMCSKSIPPRTASRIILADNKNYRICCPHCGIMMAMRLKKDGREISEVLVKDFNSGTEIAAKSAQYVLGSKVVICCVPSIISFTDTQNAQRFQQEYGGKLLDYAGIQTAIKKHK